LRQRQAQSISRSASIPANTQTDLLRLQKDCMHSCWLLRPAYAYLLVMYGTLKAVAAAQSRPEKRCTRDLQRQLLKPDFRLLRILVDGWSFCDRSRLLPTWRQQADRLFCALYHGFCGKGAKINGFWCACYSTRGRLCCSHPSFQPSLSGNALAVGQLVPGVAPARTCAVTGC